MSKTSRLSRVLPLLNLVGCVVITSLILFQWLKERRLDRQISQLNQALIESQTQAETERKRAEALDRDVAQLKESVESVAASKKEIEDAMTKLTTEANAATAGTTAAYTDQVKVWEKAIADRDEVIRNLNENLVATRQRLNQAIGEMKRAGGGGGRGPGGHDGPGGRDGDHRR